MTTATPALAATQLSGPDVSSWQHPNGAPIDWAKVRAAGNAFAIIKATEGGGYTNPYFASDTARARAAHLVVGAYAYVRPSLPISTAVSQAKHFAAVLGPIATTGTLPPILDLEETGGLSPADLTTWTQTFLETVRASTGRTPMLYSYPYFWPSALSGTLAFRRYPLWLASYRTTPPAPLPGWAAWTLWQYTSSEPVPGIPGTAIDRSRFAGTPAQLAALADGTVRTSWPVTAPAAPVGVSAVAGVQAATVRWRPGDDGGHVATGYTVTASPGGLTRTVSGTESALTFGGLRAGTRYTFTVQATNPAGRSVNSTATASVVPGQVPAAPTGVTAAVANGQVVLKWAAASGAPSAYRVYRCALPASSPNAAPACSLTGVPVATVSAPATAFTDTGRTNQVSYRYAVAAVNAWGSSPLSSVVTGTPVGPPPAPTSFLGTPTDRTVKLSWAPPLTTGGAPLTQYALTVDAGAPVILPPSARTYTASGLAGAKPHTFTVAARSALGLGPAAVVRATTLPTSAPQTLPPPSSPVPVQITVTHLAAPLPGAAVPVTVRISRTGTPASVSGLPVTIAFVPRAGTPPAALQVLTDGTGTVTVTLRPLVTGTVTATVIRSARTLPAAASALLPVRGVLTARLGTTTVRLSRPASLSGSTSRLLAGERVMRQMFYAGGWHTLAVTTVSPTGTWRFTVNATTLGPHPYRAVLPASWLHLAVASGTLTLNVTR